MTAVAIILIVLVGVAILLAILSRLVTSIMKSVSQIAGASNRCAYCKKRLKFAGGTYATVCPKCGREQPPPKLRIIKTRGQRKLGLTAAAEYTGCRYLGGFTNTRQSQRESASVTISDTRLWIDLGQGPDTWVRLDWREN